MYANGHGVAQDYVEAYMWFSIAATGGFPDSNKALDKLKETMTKAQITKAKRRAETWLAKRQ